MHQKNLSTFNSTISCNTPEGKKKQNKTNTPKKESEDEFVLKNSFEAASTCDCNFTKRKTFANQEYYVCSIKNKLSNQTSLAFYILPL